jgi:hypothetical protein
LFFFCFFFLIHSAHSSCSLFLVPLQSIEIPPTVRFSDGSPFAGLSFSSLWLESDNETFVLENRVLIDLRCHAMKEGFIVENVIKTLWWHDFRIWSSTYFSLLSKMGPRWYPVTCLCQRTSWQTRDTNERCDFSQFSDSISMK